MAGTEGRPQETKVVREDRKSSFRVSLAVVVGSSVLQDWFESGPLES